MRLRTFTAATMSEAMALVRARLGPDAVIVSTEEGEDGAMRLTAAVDHPERLAPGIEPDVIDILNEALSAHGLAPLLIEKILCAALPFETDEPLLALASAFATFFSFAPLDGEVRRPLLMAGPPGAGKTVSIAKLATRAVMAGKRVRLVTADTVRAGGIEQLEAFARVLQLPLHRADSAQRLAALGAAAEAGELLLIDAPGVNPYSAGDRRELSQLIAASGAEPVLVLPAGGDAVDTVELARIFRDLGCSRMIVTRLDMVQRLGSVIACAETLRLGFAEAGTSPEIAKGLTVFNPVVLARLILPKPVQQPRQANAMRGSP
ncbi:MAG TPA: AAA family ATPase [Stellaceae bacterium]|jgi:flagellar biosynthesis protein FlhF|nr:AAA family ATPase [Stellaceae bacterium]